MVAAVAARDDDNCHEHHVHVDLAYGVGVDGDEADPDEMEAEKVLASDQGHYYHHGHLSEPTRFLGNWNVMASLPLLSDFVKGLYPSAAEVQYTQLECCT